MSEVSPPNQVAPSEKDGQMSHEICQGEGRGGGRWVEGGFIIDTRNTYDILGRLISFLYSFCVLRGFLKRMEAP